MNKLLFQAAVVLLLIAASGRACGQSAGPVVDVEGERKARILENLQHLFPRLLEYEVTIDDFKDIGVPGIEQGSFTINGQQTQHFLITADDKKLYLLTALPVDVSLTSEELAAAREQQAEDLDREAQVRHTMLEAVRTGWPIRGNPDAPVTIVEFSDFQCPYCAGVHGTVLDVLEKYPDQVKLVYTHFPLSNHPWARPAAIAGVCAAEQSHDAFWVLHDGFFENQRQVSTLNLIEKGREFLAGTGIDLDAWASCTGDTFSDAYKAAAAKVANSLKTGTQIGVSGTPSFYINGYFFSGNKPMSLFDEMIERALENTVDS